MHNTILFNLLFMTLWAVAMMVCLRWANGHRKAPEMPQVQKVRQSRRPDHSTRVRF